MADPNDARLIRRAKLIVAASIILALLVPTVFLVLLVHFFHNSDRYFRGIRLYAGCAVVLLGGGLGIVASIRLLRLRRRQPAIGGSRAERARAARAVFRRGRLGEADVALAHAIAERAANSYRLQAIETPCIALSIVGIAVMLWGSPAGIVCLVYAALTLVAGLPSWLASRRARHFLAKSTPPGK